MINNDIIEYLINNIKPDVYLLNDKYVSEFTISDNDKINEIFNLCDVTPIQAYAMIVLKFYIDNFDVDIIDHIELEIIYDMCNPKFKNIHRSMSLISQHNINLFYVEDIIHESQTIYNNQKRTDPKVTIRNELLELDIDLITKLSNVVNKLILSKHIESNSDNKREILKDLSTDINLLEEEDILEFVNNEKAKIDKSISELLKLEYSGRRKLKQSISGSIDVINDIITERNIKCQNNKDKLLSFSYCFDTIDKDLLK